jgi:hypothetical protein
MMFLYIQDVEENFLFICFISNGVNMEYEFFPFLLSTTWLQLELYFVSVEGLMITHMLK